MITIFFKSGTNIRTNYVILSLIAGYFLRKYSKTMAWNLLKSSQLNIKWKKYNGHESILSVNVLGISNCRRM